MLDNLVQVTRTLTDLLCDYQKNMICVKHMKKGGKCVCMDKGRDGGGDDGDGGLKKGECVERSEKGPAYKHFLLTSISLLLLIRCH